jgi:hypothetical protein
LSYHGHFCGILILKVGNDFHSMLKRAFEDIKLYLQLLMLHRTNQSCYSIYPIPVHAFCSGPIGHATSYAKIRIQIFRAHQN